MARAPFLLMFTSEIFEISHLPNFQMSLPCFFPPLRRNLNCFPELQVRFCKDSQDKDSRSQLPLELDSGRSPRLTHSAPGLHVQIRVQTRPGTPRAAAACPQALGRPAPSALQQGVPGVSAIR